MEMRLSAQVHLGVGLVIYTSTVYFFRRFILVLKCVCMYVCMSLCVCMCVCVFGYMLMSTDTPWS